MRAVSAAWQVAGSSGAGLATVVDRIGTGLRSDEEARAEVRAALGPPRATARLLAVLPLFGVALGSSVGSHPVHVLLHTTWGWCCLSGASVLALTGVWWVDRLASAAET
jgi:tight adherence protein B